MSPARTMDAEILSQVCGFDVIWRDACPSTQAIAGDLARAGHPDPILVVADHQTAGRGRLGRQWWSRPGEGLLFSIVLRPDVPASQVARGVLVWGAVLAAILDVWLKWPNDLVDRQDRKVGGMLAELEVDGTRVRHVVLGVGINVSQSSFPALPEASSLLLSTGRAEDRATLLARIAPALLSTDIAAPGALDPWRARSRTLGRRVSVGGREGIATGLRDDGALLVDGRPVLAGDVHLVGG